MSLLNRLKEKLELRKIERDAIDAVEEAKEREINNQKAKKFEDEAKEFAEKLGVTVEEAIIYLKSERKKKRNQKTKKHFIEEGNKVLKTVGKWAEGADARLIEPETKKPSDDSKEQLEKQPKKKKEKMNFDFAIGMLGGDKK